MACSFADSCADLVRSLISSVFDMPAGRVLAAGQSLPNPAEVSDFATVKIPTAQLIQGGFARTYANQTYPEWSSSTAYEAGAQVTHQVSHYICTQDVTGGTSPATDPGHWGLTTAPTKVIESIEGCYAFTVSVQFFRHADPASAATGTSGLVMGAFDKASRIEAILALSPNLDLMDRLGLYLVSVGTPTNVGALIDDPVWNDRGSVDLTFTVSNVETTLIESLATAEIDLSFQGQAGIDHKTIKVQP